jgi:hypothetical protein
MLHLETISRRREKQLRGKKPRKFQESIEAVDVNSELRNLPRWCLLHQHVVNLKQFQSFDVYNVEARAASTHDDTSSTQKPQRQQTEQSTNETDVLR